MPAPIESLHLRHTVRPRVFRLKAGAEVHRVFGKSPRLRDARAADHQFHPVLTSDIQEIPS